ncbi:hypothetical protein MJO29_006422 [Puccinia striiformis f. sp. tritici]|nr:hypothetical protein MJO29_006422 [Puccinia striiformis f. sp. tritici]
MQQSNDSLRRAYASERQARQHAVAPFPFPHNPIYNDYHLHQQPIPHLHQQPIPHHHQQPVPHHHQQQPVPHHPQQPIPHHQQQPIIHQHEFSNNYIQRMNHSRWVAAPEACWRIFSFKPSATYASMNRLDIHLPDQHQVTSSQDEQLENVIERGAEAKTMLTGYFARNRIDANARRLKYAKFPQHYTWHPKTNGWKPRQRGCSIGRIYAVYPSDPERGYLRLLLNHVTGATSFEHLRTFHGRICDSFRSAALARGLLENDHYLEATMAEEDESMMPSYLRRLFGNTVSNMSTFRPCAFM